MQPLSALIPSNLTGIEPSRQTSIDGTIAIGGVGGLVPAPFLAEPIVVSDEAASETKARTSDYVDSKFRNICLILSVMVVFNHSRTVDMTYGWDGINLSPVSWEYFKSAPFEIGIQHFLSGTLGRITNPFFFLTSGFLFFYGWNPSWRGWAGKMQKRVHTLLLPLILWSVLGMFISFLFSLASQPDRAWARALADPGQWGGLARQFLETATPGQHWFVRALLLIMLGAPLIGWLLARTREKSLLIILAVYLSPIQTPWDWVDKSALCFFSWGAALGFLKTDVELKSRVWSKCFIAVWLAGGLIYAVLSLAVEWDLTLLFKFVILSGLVGIWALYDWMPEWMHRGLDALAPYRFFIYMGFDPLLTICQTKYFEAFQASQVLNLAEYLFLPLIVVTICTVIACLLARGMPRTYSVLTGGR